MYPDPVSRSLTLHRCVPRSTDAENPTPQASKTPARTLLTSTEPGTPGIPAELRRLDLKKSDAVLSKILADLLPNVFEDKEAIEELRSHLGEGCHLEGYFTVKKVAGNFRFALYKEDHHVLMSVFGRNEALNVSHVIHSISFGEIFPGLVNPLDGVSKTLNDGSGFFQ